MDDLHIAIEGAAQDFSAIHLEAHEAGMKAGQDIATVAMQVTDDKTIWHVADGVCGFAWVHFNGNTAWSRWAKRKGIASNDYPSGKMVWVNEFNQSMRRKEAYAHAYAEVLNKHGIRAYALSRMD